MFSARARAARSAAVYSCEVRSGRWYAMNREAGGQRAQPGTPGCPRPLPPAPHSPMMVPLASMLTAVS